MTWDNNSGGLLGGFGDAGADQKTADQYGITQEMLSAQRYSSLGNIGAILLAAAQPGPVGQRGQMFSQLAGVSGNAAAGMKDAVQARMAGVKLKEAQDDLARKQQLRQIVADDKNLTPDQRSWATANPEGYFQARGQSQLSVQQAKDQQAALMPGQLDYAKQLGGVQTDNAIRQETALAPVRTDAAVKQAQALAPIQLDHTKQLAIVQSQAPVQAKVDALKASGLDEATAQGIASGRLIHSPAEDEQGNKTIGIFDLGTGQQINAKPRAALNPDQQSIVSALPTTGKGGKPLDYSEATGGAGWAKNAWNIISSNITGKPTFADADKAKQALEQLNTRTMTSLTAEIPGRETNQMREQLSGLGVRTGDITQPDAMAHTKLTQTKQFVDSAIIRQEAQLAEGGMSRTDRSKIRTNLGQLKQLQAEYGTVLDHFGNAAVPQQTPGSPATATGNNVPQFRILSVR